jgi:hypothetical protein
VEVAFSYGKGSLEKLGANFGITWEGKLLLISGKSTLLMGRMVPLFLNV